MQGLDRTGADDSPWGCADTATTVSKARHAEPQLLRRCSRAPGRIRLSPRDANMFSHPISGTGVARQPMHDLII